MNRYMVFFWDKKAPAGGWNDCAGTFETLGEAKACLSALKRTAITKIYAEMDAAITAAPTPVVRKKLIAQKAIANLDKIVGYQIVDTRKERENSTACPTWSPPQFRVSRALKDA